MKSVTAENLVKTYRKGAVRALDDLSLDVEEGTVLGVLGPNGAGKTTVVRVLSTLLVPDAGRATVGGIDVVKNPKAVRQIIGLSGQYAVGSTSVRVGASRILVSTALSASVTGVRSGLVSMTRSRD